MELEKRIKNLSTAKRKLLAAQVIARDGFYVDTNVSEEKYSKIVACIVSSETVEIEKIREHLRHKLPDYMVPSSIIQLEELPRLPNGKIDKKELSNRLETDSFTRFDHVPAETTDQERILKIWIEILGIQNIGIHDNFFEIGGDSILSIRIVSKLRENGFQVTPADIFKHQTIADLAYHINDRVTKITDKADNAYVGQIPLLPIHYWFFNEHEVAPHHWNQALKFSKVKKEVGEIEQAVECLINRHEALRLRFAKTAGRWESMITSTGATSSFRKEDIAHLDEEKREQFILETLSEMHSSLDLENRSLFQAVYFDGGGSETNQLVLIAHHLIVDSVSWQLIIEDLNSAIEDILQNRISQPTISGLAYHEWANYLCNLSQEKYLMEDLDFWLEQGHDEQFPLDMEGKIPYPEESVVAHTFHLDEKKTKDLLYKSSSAYGTRVDDLMIIALVGALSSWLKSSKICIGVERHGRDHGEQDLSEAVGWLTSYFPVTLEIDEKDDLADLIKSVKEQLRKVPNNGISYGVLRYMSNAPSAANLDQQPQIIFNYLGSQNSQNFKHLGYPEMIRTNSRDPRSERYHLFEINSFVQNDCLSVVWEYCKYLHRAGTIEMLSEHFSKSLSDIIDHCLDKPDRSYTSSDFPDIDMSQEDIDKLLNGFS